MHLSKNVLKELILNSNVVSDFADIDAQLTANGFDVRVAAIVEIESGGRLAVSKANHVAPKLGSGAVLKGFEDRVSGYETSDLQVVEEGVVKLERLKPYLVVTCEKVNTPNNLMIHAGPRSSLFRLTQSLLGLTFTEAGYSGYLTFLLVPFADSEVELGARIAQLSFSELKGEANYSEQKESSYQGGKLF